MASASTTDALMAEVQLDGFSYDDFCLKTMGFYEYKFHDMRKIVEVSGMDRWIWKNSKARADKSSPNIFISLVLVDPSQLAMKSNKRSDKVNAKRGQQAIETITAMLTEAFASEEQESIAHCVSRYPTLAIFAMTSQRKSAPRKSGACHPRSSILDFGVKSSPKCISALNYYCTQDAKYSQVLWFGTTIEEPFKEQVITTWRYNGIGGFLFLLLAKQHTASDANIEGSTICLQCPGTRKEAFQFYQKLGLSKVPEPLGGDALSTTPVEFQDKVKSDKFLWITSEGMLLLRRVMNGQLRVPLPFDEDLSGDKDSDEEGTVEVWNPTKHTYAEFPTRKLHDSDIESACDSLPVLAALTGGESMQLPRCNVYHNYLSGKSTIAGSMTAEARMGFEG